MSASSPSSNPPSLAALELQSLALFNDLFNAIKHSIANLRTTIPNVRVCCQDMVFLLSTIRAAVPNAKRLPDLISLALLGATAIEIASQSLQKAFAQKIPPGLAEKRWFPALVRRLDPRSPETLRRSVLLISLDRIYAHEALCMGMDSVMEEEGDFEECEVGDFFGLVRLAFELSLGGLVVDEDREFHPDYKVQVEARREFGDVGWCSAGFEFSVWVLLALVRCHSQWFHGAEVRVAGQVVSQDISRPPLVLANNGVKDIDISKAKNAPYMVLTGVETAVWERQRAAMASLFSDTGTTDVDFVRQVRAAMDIVRVSIEAHKSGHRSASDSFTKLLFSMAHQALRFLMARTKARFVSDHQPLGEAFNPDSQPRPFPTDGARWQRQWAALTNLDHLYRCKAADSNRLILAETTLIWISGTANKITPSATGPGVVVAVPAAPFINPEWLADMLDFTSFALVGVGQHLLECFKGGEHNLQLWNDKDEFPKTIDQATKVWIGHFEWEGKLYPTVPGR